MLPMPLAAELTRHHHLLSRARAVELGFEDRDLRRLVTSGDLVSVHRGMYTSSAHWEATPSVQGRELIRALAVSRMMDSAHLLSHDSAAHALGLAFLSPRTPRVHVTRPGEDGARHQGITQHCADFDMHDVTITEYGPVLSVARTACDLARQHGFLTGVSACDSALRLGVPRAELVRSAGRMTHWRGVRAVRAAISCADPGAENPAESLTRILVTECGFGVPETQFPVQLPHQVAWCDLRVGAHLVEFDGRVKYRRATAGGVATEGAAEVVWRERTRERALIDAGFGVSRLVWADLAPAAWAHTRARLTREIAATFERWGPNPSAEAVAFADRTSPSRQATLAI